MELPEELMTLILLKLPAKSLFRFKCVKKSWYSLINSPFFVRLHLSSIIKKNDCFIATHFHRKGKQNVLSLHTYETLGDLGNQINMPFSFDGGVDLCGSCAGLVCLSNYKDQIVICNPTIREFRPLFVPPALCKRSGYNIESVAFGSDPNTGKYTVVMIGVPISDDDVDCNDPEARLYDFSTDSWRETAAALPPGDTFHYSRFAVSLNGAFHWCPDDRSKNILTFHMSNEVTELIPLPDFDVVGVDHEKELCVSPESQLSFVLYYVDETRFEIYVMTEYGVKESWTRLFNISGPSLRVFFYRPIVFWDEQRLFFRNEIGKLVSCDLQHHQNLRTFQIDGNFDLYPISQSLVSVNGIGRRPII